MYISTCSPIFVAIATKVSNANSSIFPRNKSETRGCVTPSFFAAADWLNSCLSNCAFTAIINSERSFMFSASSVVSSMASHTLVNFFFVIFCSSSTHEIAAQPVPNQSSLFVAFSFENSAIHKLHPTTLRHKSHETRLLHRAHEFPAHQGQLLTLACSHQAHHRAALGLPGNPLLA
jgi:hypothetical protein